MSLHKGTGRYGSFNGWSVVCDGCGVSQECADREEAAEINEDCGGFCAMCQMHADYYEEDGTLHVYSVPLSY